jgi:acetyl esterase/lipase
MNPYGTWRSSISATAVAAGALALEGIAVDGEDVYWIERRPAEGGRHVLVRRTPDGRLVDVTPAGTDVRTRVHEYGGGACLVSQGTVYFSEFADQRVYRLETGGRPVPLTLEGGWFYADYAIHSSGRWLVCVREDHTVRGAEPVNTLVILPLDRLPTAGEVIAEGHDFYSTPRYSPDGTRLVWLAWRHPNMPWDSTELWVAEVMHNGHLERPRLVAGGPGESIFQPGWSPDGTVYFVLDRGGWWNLYRLEGQQVVAVQAMEAEFGRPQWRFGTSTWAFVDSARLLVSYRWRGRWRLATIDVSSGRLTPIAADVEPGEFVTATRTHAIFAGHSPRAPDAVMRVHLETGFTETLRSAFAADLDPRSISEPEPIEFPTDEGLAAHAFYYPPRNPDFIGPAGDRPPLIVISHGGPTGAASTRLNLELQYWTSRGFAVVDVDYGGSSGYGRAYRQRLSGRWGLVDVVDCVNAARYLVERGKADAERLIIRGRSAGGYTTLAALAFHPAVFKAGASYYGVSDIEVLAADTHKFESRYLDTLVGPYPARRDLYRARSPIHFVDRLSCALILFQGLEDRIVPPNKARMMADAVRASGLPVALLTFEGEQHGFRRKETIVRCLEAELSFYGAVFGFQPADPLPPIPIDNLARP